jgi:hypothetical protein
MFAEFLCNHFENFCWKVMFKKLGWNERKTGFNGTKMEEK